MKECPYCGSEAKVRKHGMFWFVVCGKCKAHTTYASSEEKAIEKWEQRAPLSDHSWETLKSCPFCGNIGIAHDAVWKKHVTYCNKCYAATNNYKNRSKADEAWNMRSIV